MKAFKDYPRNLFLLFEVDVLVYVSISDQEFLCVLHDSLLFEELIHYLKLFQNTNGQCFGYIPNRFFHRTFLGRRILVAIMSPTSCEFLRHCHKVRFVTHKENVTGGWGRSRTIVSDRYSPGHNFLGLELDQF